MSSYSVAIVTFRRESSLAVVLDALGDQTLRPTCIAVADNDDSSSVAGIVSQTAARTGLEIIYLPMGDNRGPAGGWAHAVGELTTRASRGEWVAMMDDDDPVANPSVMRDLMLQAQQSSDDVAAVGLRGARLNLPLATLHRVEPSTGMLTDVDYLASGGAPLYRWNVIDQHGFFDERLFFGFEDLEYGLRLKTAGLKTCVAAVDHHDVQDTSPVRVDWREYYKSRALAVICRRHLGPVPTIATVLRVGLVGAGLLLLKQRQLKLIVARWRGIVDGLNGSLGVGPYRPGSNPAKPRPV